MASTLFTPGTAFLTVCSPPRVRVSWDIGHPPQAPFNLAFTTPSVVPSTSSTSPPSACRAGLIFSNAFSTCSLIFLLLSPPHPLPLPVGERGRVRGILLINRHGSTWAGIACTPKVPALLFDKGVRLPDLLSSDKENS